MNGAAQRPEGVTQSVAGDDVFAPDLALQAAFVRDLYPRGRKPKRSGDRREQAGDGSAGRGRRERTQLRSFGDRSNRFKENANAGLRRVRIGGEVKVVAIERNQLAKGAAWKRQYRLGTAHGVTGDIVSEQTADVYAGRVDIRAGGVAGVGIGMESGAGFGRPASAADNRLPEKSGAGRSHGR